jgi:uncharacterized OB-fold protein
MGTDITVNIIKNRKLGRGVALVGAVLCKFGAYKDKTIREFLLDSFTDMQKSVDKGFNNHDIEAMYLSPRLLYSDCSNVKIVWVELNGKGKLAAFTIITVGTPVMIAKRYNRNKPYVTGIVQVEKGSGIRARIINVEPGSKYINIGISLTVDLLEEKSRDERPVVLAFNHSRKLLPAN